MKQIGFAIVGGLLALVGGYGIGSKGRTPTQMEIIDALRLIPDGDYCNKNGCKKVATTYMLDQSGNGADLHTGESR